MNNDQINQIKALLKWFKEDFFTWTDKAKCQSCGDNKDNMERHGMATPTNEDREFNAFRVENFRCKNCNVFTRFPRYNNP